MAMIRIEDVGQYKLDRVNTILSSIPGGAQKALSAALKRAAESGKGAAAKYASSVYNISQGTFTGLCNISMTGGSLTIMLSYAGSVIPLKTFNPTGHQQGDVKVAVLRGPRKPVPHAWLGNGYGYGVWERIGKPRFPIKEDYGPSTGHMVANDAVSGPLADHIQDVFDTRIEHEITRLLNGW